MTDMISPGVHLLIDLWEAGNLQDMDLIEHALRASAEICGATVLDVNMHSFGEGAGITGVAILAESHISIHTWPEIGFAAVDIFLCGACDPHLAVPVLKEYFGAGQMVVREYRRGVCPKPERE